MKTKQNKSKNVNLFHGDLFNHLEESIYAGNNGTSIIVPHVCNNIDSFSGGFAGAVSNRYPIVKENYHLLGNKNAKLGYVQFIDVAKSSNHNHNHKLIFANMIAQNGVIHTYNPRPINYLALVKCMVSVKQYIEKNYYDEPVQIRCPKFGSGLAGGNWLFIENLIEDIWNNITVNIYSNIKSQ
jgi:hypothetical protein